MTDLMIDLKGVAEMAGCSKRTISRAVELGQLPKPVFIASCPRWFRDDIVRALKRQQESTDTRTAAVTPRCIAGA